MRNIYTEQGTEITWYVPAECEHNEQAFTHNMTWCETCGAVLSDVVRVALRNEYGGITRTADLDSAEEGTAWQYAYDEGHRNAYPATADSVQVRMADGSWTNATIVR